MACGLSLSCSVVVPDDELNKITDVGDGAARM